MVYNCFSKTFLILHMLLGSSKVQTLPKEFDNIPKSHFKYFGLPSFEAENCKADGLECKVNNIPQTLKRKQLCWGYEKDCKLENMFSYPNCFSHDARWASSLEKQQHLFWEQGDFGYLKKFKEGMLDICKPKSKEDSSLICAENMVYCEAKNIFINFKNLHTSSSNDRFKEDVFKQGEIGGHCSLNQVLLREQGSHKSPLQSWFAELQSYTSLDKDPIQTGSCHIVIEKPVYFIKLDAGINMFHHFCDFVNLYASQHMNGSFSTDIYIVMWDTSNYPYRDFFEDTWKAFTDYPIIRLNEYENKKVCFKDAVFPLLARMIRGLYYNMPLVPGCQKAGLFKAFSEHVLHRLKIKQDSYEDDVVRVTLLVRNTQYRNILNQDELIGAMKRYKSLNVTAVEYNLAIPFSKQLQITHNADVFIGMHGAGLTHLLFLPDWASAFELYNTEDPNCYQDLANLRGVHYITWQRREKLFQQDEGHHPTLGKHSKFTNYAFDVDEFMRLLETGIKSVLANRPKRKVP